MMGTLLHFSKYFSAVFNETFWTLTREKIVNMAVFVLFSFLQLCNVKGTYSKYFQNNIYKIDISSAAQQSNLINL